MLSNERKGAIKTNENCQTNRIALCRFPEHSPGLHFARRFHRVATPLSLFLFSPFFPSFLFVSVGFLRVDCHFDPEIHISNPPLDPVDFLSLARTVFQPRRRFQQLVIDSVSTLERAISSSDQISSSIWNRERDSL